jgi:hypothetical protein
LSGLIPLRFVYSFLAGDILSLKLIKKEGCRQRLKNA